MKKETKKKENKPDVALLGGKWVTSDGMCFNTSAKAWKHIEETTAQEPPVEDPSSGCESIIG